MGKKRFRATKKGLEEIAKAVTERSDKWRYGDVTRIANLFGVCRKTVAKIARQCGVTMWDSEKIKALVKKNPNLTLREVSKISGLSYATLCVKNKKEGINCKRQTKVDITQEKIEGMSFGEIKEKYGYSDSYLSHLIRRKGLTVKSKKGLICGLKPKK